MDRPKGVPKAAAWCDAHKSWEVGRREGDVHRGDFRAWSEEGDLWWTGSFDAKGKQTGRLRRFYTDGSPQREGDFVDGRRHGLWTFYLGEEADASSDYLVFLGAPPEIRRWTMDFVEGRGRGLSGMKFYDAAGAELDRWGRPAGTKAPAAPERAGLNAQKLHDKLNEACGNRGAQFPGVLNVVDRPVLVRDLISQGADARRAGWADRTALHYAAEIADPGAVEILLEAGAAASPRDRDLRTPLLETLKAARASDADRGRTIELLLAKGASWEEAGRDGLTLMDRACAEGRIDVVRLLLGKNIALPTSGTTPLHIAARAGNEALARLLIEAGALLDARDEGRKRPYDLAKAGGHAHLLTMLQKAGAAPPPRTDVKGGDLNREKVMAALRFLARSIGAHVFFEEKKDVVRLEDLVEAYFADKETGSSEEMVAAIAPDGPYWITMGLLLILDKASGAKPSKRTLGKKEKPPLFHKGDLFFDADFQLTRPLLVTGDLTVEGILSDGGADSVLVAGGKVRARAFNTNGDVVILGGLHVDEVVYGHYNDQVLRVEGGLTAKALIEDDHDVMVLGGLKVKHRFKRLDYPDAGALLAKVFVADVLKNSKVDRQKLFARIAAGKPVLRGR